MNIAFIQKLYDSVPDGTIAFKGAHGLYTLYQLCFHFLMDFRYIFVARYRVWDRPFEHSSDCLFIFWKIFFSIHSRILHTCSTDATLLMYALAGRQGARAGRQRRRLGAGTGCPIIFGGHCSSQRHERGPPLFTVPLNRRSWSLLVSV